MGQNSYQKIFFLKKSFLIPFLGLLVLVVLFYESFLVDDFMSDRKEIPSVFAGKDIKFYSKDKEGLLRLKAGRASMFSEQKDIGKQVLLKEKVHLFSQKNNQEAFIISSEEATLLWDKEKSQKEMSRDNLETAIFRDDVIAHKEKEFLLTEELRYFHPKEIASGDKGAQILSQEGYLEANRFFEWRLKDEVFLIKEGAEGVSYGEK